MSEYNMSRSNVKLLDLPDEILLIILKKLNNIDVLYSLLDVDNGHLNSLLQEKIFLHTLNFVSIDNVSSIDQHKLHRFCTDILPKIHQNVECLILEPMSMERILLAADYPNLTELKLFNFKQEVASNYFTNESSLRCIFQEKIKNLSLAINEKHTSESSENYIRNVYGHVLKFFKNLKDLSINETSNSSYPPLLLCDSPSTNFFSSTLTHLCITVCILDDCLYLLDGRLKQLNTLIIRITFKGQSSSVIHNMDDLPNLKCFSLKCYLPIHTYDEKIVSLLHRMRYLEKLTLYLRVQNRGTFIDYTYLDNEILSYMPYLHSFTFYISTYIDTDDLFRFVPSQGIQQIATNTGHQQLMANIIKYNSARQVVCSIFSLPFVFNRLQDIGHIFPDFVFEYVTNLVIQDVVSLNREFFLRVARSFPSLNKLDVRNLILQLSCNINSLPSNDSQSYSVVKFPHLTKLAIIDGNIDNVEQFLNETKTFVPCLTTLLVDYNDLKIVTESFTREETRRNCSKIKRLVLLNTLICTEDYCYYFPSL